MNKRIAIPIIGVLVCGLIAAACSGANELTDAQDEIAGLQGDVSGLEAGLADSEAEVSALGTELTVSKAELVDSAARVATLEVELDQATSAAQTQQSLNLTLAEELKKVKGPRHFESVTELEAWLAQDNTDTRTRWESMPLRERAFVLQVRALRDGYLLPAWFFDPELTFVGNLAYIGAEIWWVWPDDDLIELMVDVVPPIPSRPLSLDEES